MARLPCYDLSQLCREPVCGRQLSQKLVTVQPPTYQPNGLFIRPRAMHYGWEQSPLMPPILSHSVFNAAEENCLIPAEIKPVSQSTCATLTRKRLVKVKHIEHCSCQRDHWMTHYRVFFLKIKNTTFQLWFKLPSLTNSKESPRERKRNEQSEIEEAGEKCTQGEKVWAMNGLLRLSPPYCI